MPRLEWGSAGTRFYEAGVDRGVLYVGESAGVPWSGLISVSETTTGGEAQPFYIDGVKYSNTASAEEFEATITAFTYPDLFSECDGSHQPRSGMFLTQQRRKSFGMSYRTKIGNDITDGYGYKIHIVYNALASPSERPNATVNESVEVTNFAWNLTTRPPEIEFYRPTSHVILDTRFTDPDVITVVEDILYGSDTEPARLPSVEELIAAYDTVSSLIVVDNGDGTWTATAPFDVIRMLDSTTFEITAPTAVFIDEETYTLSSE